MTRESNALREFAQLAVPPSESEAKGWPPGAGADHPALAGAETETPGQNVSGIEKTLPKVERTLSKVFLSLPKLNYAASKRFEDRNKLKCPASKVFIPLSKLKCAPSKVEMAQEKSNYRRPKDF
jgi:hypothetical protein